MSSEAPVMSAVIVMTVGISDSSATTTVNFVLADRPAFDAAVRAGAGEGGMYDVAQASSPATAEGDEIQFSPRKLGVGGVIGIVVAALVVLGASAGGVYMFVFATPKIAPADLS